MQTPRLAILSCVSGLTSVAAFGAGLVLLQIFPPTAGHKSAAFSEAGGLLLLISTISFVLAPVALVTGIKALRRFTAEATKGQRIAAWVGLVAGGTYAAVLVLPFLVLLWR
jgi:hypothetical protein